MSALRPRVAAAAAVAFALTAGYFAQGTYAAVIPANKVAASGSSVERLDATADTLLLSETVKINNPTDLILGVSLECAINTKVTNSANGHASTAFGQIEMLRHDRRHARPGVGQQPERRQGRVLQPRAGPGVDQLRQQHRR